MGFSIKIRKIDAKGEVTHPSMSISLSGIDEPEAALSKVQGGVAGMIFQAGATPLTIPKANLLGWRIDSEQATYLIEHMTGPLIGTIYDMKGGGFQGLGGKLFGALLSSNLTPIQAVEKALDSYGTISNFISNPDTVFDKDTGMVADKMTGTILGKFEAVTSNLEDITDPDKAINKVTGEITDKLTGSVVGNLEGVDNLNGKVTDILKDPTKIINTATGIVTDKATGAAVGAIQKISSLGGQDFSKILSDPTKSINLTTGDITDKYSGETIGRVNGITDIQTKAGKLQKLDRKRKSMS